MIKNSYCKRFTDCAQCPKAAQGTFVYRNFPRGQHFPADKCTQNCILFMIKGELLVNSQEYPGTSLRDGQFILQAIGSKIELLAQKWNTSYTGSMNCHKYVKVITAKS